jgi:hypothetical protein
MRARSLVATIVAAATMLVGMPSQALAQDLPDLGQILESVQLPGGAKPPESEPASIAPRAAKGSKNFATAVDPLALFEGEGGAGWADTTAGLGASQVRLDLGWRHIVSGVPANPSDPADPAYDFSALDRAVSLAAARNLGILITFQEAPDYAEEDGGKPNGSSLPDGAWKPEPNALGEFAKAVATRYSGAFQGLPRVRDFEAWNEGNLNGFLAPQYDGKKLVAPDRYRRMVVAVDQAIDSVHGDNRVVVGSLAPYGDEPGGARTRPLEFLRELFCLNGKL